jgi:hypothetical protein
MTFYDYQNFPIHRYKSYIFEAIEIESGLRVSLDAYLHLHL